ncbi:beta-N-acetylhexosaminidase [Georgenia satyanarayanai]|uniref:beta-N-acetylhexosaminidase n=1 Tax=Georgenia satyanarayanai TaxID=860221 RepID=UPI00203ED4F6|nr:beta-N-acetylhexosaminidase [Georgenia satyanarayanai]MCM3659940.1 beta-N-acetylhexosaminidase [Georgenia satyanarayanai]
MTTSSTALRRAALGTVMPGFAGDSVPDWLVGLLGEGLGGVCLFASNITSSGGVRALTAQLRDAGPDVVIAVDEEGGDVTRLWHHAGGSAQPGNAVLGRLDDEEVTACAARTLATELRAVGVTVTFGPVADVNSNPDNPVIGTRSFGTEPDLVARHVATWVRALQEGGVAACTKHFPGHGDTATDSHLTLPVVDRSAAELTTRELLPFAAAVRAGVEAVMTSHILLPRIDPHAPATMSAPVIDGLLRTDLGFEGVVVTDALDMAGASGRLGMAGAAVAALAAGADLLCLGAENTAAEVEEIVDAVTAAVREGRLSEERLSAACRRNRGLAGRYPAPADLTEPARSGAVVPTARIAATFELSSRARDLLARSGRVLLVRLDSVPNIAVGPGRWGPFELVPASQVLTAEGALEAARTSLAPEDVLVVVGRDNHLHPSSREMIDTLRSAHAATLVVDMGWARADAGLADVATYGASPAVGRALLELLKAGGPA